MAENKKTETQPIEWTKAMDLLYKMKKEPIEQNTRLMLACGFFFGLRINRILSLTWEQIMQESFEIIEKKTGKKRTISLDPKFKEIRDEVIESSRSKGKGLLFTYNRAGADQTKPISVVAANKRIKKTFEKYKIKCKNPSSHTLRKTFGMRVYQIHNECEHALILLSQIFNHRDTAVTRRYIGITQKVIQNAYLSLSSGDPLYK